MADHEDEVVVADFGAGCKITGKRLEGETDKDVKMRFARAKMEREEERLRANAERKQLTKLLSNWKPPKDTVYKERER